MTVKGGFKLIKFHHENFIKLKPVDNSVFEGILAPILIGGEKIIGSFEGLSDGVVFTSKRIIAVSTQ
ncbi:MAG: PH domain-containing protein, partial [Oscillospiraceae bacterium]|nr:PH domain-containing protein [Oscillospiraceae bacterium]